MKGILRNNESDFQYAAVDSVTDQYVVQLANGNRFRNTQNVFGGYTTYQYAGEGWGIKAGVRIEETVIDANFSSVDVAVSTNVKLPKDWRLMANLQLTGPTINLHGKTN